MFSPLAQFFTRCLACLTNHSAEWVWISATVAFPGATAFFVNTPEL
jgi:hypothetical protein